MRRMNKILSFAIICILVTTTLSIIMLPSVSAATYSTHACLSLSPDPVGVYQQVNVVAWLDRAASGAAIGNDIRFHNYTVTVLDPNGTIEYDASFWTPDYVGNWTCWDTTSSSFGIYVPMQVGKYNFTFSYPGEYLNGNTYLPSNITLTLTVQQDQIPEAIDSYPLPTEYWTRPIDNQNTFWYSISSNWLNSVRDRDYGGNLNNRYQPDGTAPNTAHIMWSAPVTNSTDILGASNFVSSFYDNPMFAKQIIMWGRLYYPLPNPINTTTSGGWRVVDLRTGQIYFNYAGADEPQFGAYLNLDTPNQHGVIPWGTIYTANFARALEAQYIGRTATTITQTILNVPGGIDAIGGKGEQLRIGVANIGSAANPYWVARQWNTSKLISTSGTQPSASAISNASATTYFDFILPITLANNAQAQLQSDTVEAGLILTQDPYNNYNVTNEILLCRNGTLPSPASNNTNSYQYFAISLINQTINHKHLHAGEIMWTQTYTAPSGNTVLAGPAAYGVWTNVIQETGQWFGYDMYSGNKLWQTDPQLNDTPYCYTASTNASGATVSIAEDKLFTAGYSGIVYCYDIHNGSLLWKKAFPVQYAANVQNYPTNIGAICDGKIYLGTYNPTGSQSLLTGAQIHCLNTTDGTEIWSMPSFGSPGGFAISDGYMVYLNYYDLNIYSVGRGPSSTTVSASPDIYLNGENVNITGTVTDASPGSAIKGSAAISDKDMGAWMAYEFMGAAKPDATGVDVTLSVVDPNGNNYDIGTATGNSDGTFNLEWTPPVPGTYQVTANFAGTNSYYSSFAHTTFYVSGESVPTQTPPANQPVSNTEVYLLTITTAIIAELIIGLAAIALMLRKKP